MTSAAISWPASSGSSPKVSEVPAEAGSRAMSATGPSTTSLPSARAAPPPPAREPVGLARAGGGGAPRHRLYPVLPRIWYGRGELAEATELRGGAIEAARLLGSPPALAGNLFNRSVVALAVGDLDIALATAEESVELTRDLDEGFVTAWAAARLAGVLFETGQPHQAIELLLGRAGGEELTLIPGGWRTYCLELLTRCWLALDRPSEAARAAALAEVIAAAVQLPLAATCAGRAVAAVALATTGRTAQAVTVAEEGFADHLALGDGLALAHPATHIVHPGFPLTDAGRLAAAGQLARAAVYAALLLFVLFYLLPVYVALTGSLKTLREVNTTSIWSLPSSLYLGAWGDALAVIAAGAEQAERGARGLNLPPKPGRERHASRGAEQKQQHRYPEHLGNGLHVGNGLDAHPHRVADLCLRNIHRFEHDLSAHCQVLDLLKAALGARGCPLNLHGRLPADELHNPSDVLDH